MLADGASEEVRAALRAISACRVDNIGVAQARTAEGPGIIALASVLKGRGKDKKDKSSGAVEMNGGRDPDVDEAARLEAFAASSRRKHCACWAAQEVHADSAMFSA